MSEPADALLGAHLRPPRFRPGFEERLRLLRARRHWHTGSPGPLTEFEFESLPPDRQTAEVTDVLPDRQRPVDMLGVVETGRNQCLVLGDERVRALLKTLPILRRPPVDEVAVPVVARTLIVEAVPDLVDR